MYKLLLIVIVFSPIYVKATECSDREIANLKSIASNINYSYEYYEKNNSIYFDVTINNIYSDIYIVDTDNNKKYTTEEVIIKNKENGQKLKYEVYAKNCNNELLNTKTMLLPTYNKYYKNPLCEGINEYKYCTKWGKYSITENELEKYVTDYKNKITIVDEEEVIQYKTEIKGFYVFIALLESLFVIILVFIFKGKKRAKNII